MNEPPKPPGPSDEWIQAQIAKHNASESRRKSQQGLGREIIATKMNGLQVVAVKNTVYYGKWTTFYEFLEYYVRNQLGEEWGNAELIKPFEERHPVLKWYEAKTKYQNQVVKEPGKIHTALMTGATAAYYGLAYNLYLLAHNATGDADEKLRAKLLHRLRLPDQFHGAYYETLVAALCITSGLKLELEDEGKPGDHPEFFATDIETGTIYSVEAKSRAPNKPHLAIRNQLRKALQKDIPHERLVFIDVNVPAGMVAEREKLLDGIAPAVKACEDMVFDTGPAPRAFVIVTNHPYHYDLDGTGIGRAAIAVGYKIDDFGVTAMHEGLIAAFKAKRKYLALYRVMEALAKYRIPATFDGEVAEFAFGEAERRFNIGQTYKLDEFEPGAVGVLTTGVVSPKEKIATVFFHLADGRNQMLQMQLSDAEVAAYEAHPETFFGVQLKVGKQLGNDPLALFEFFYDSYKDAPRERILEFFAKSHDLEDLKKLPDDELRLVYCERSVYGTMKATGKGPAGMGPGATDDGGPDEKPK